MGVLGRPTTQFGGGVGEPAELLPVPVGGRCLQRVEPGGDVPQVVPCLGEPVLGRVAGRRGPGPGGQRPGQGDSRGLDRGQPGGQPIRFGPGVGAQVGGVAGEERGRGGVGLDEPGQGALHVLHVAERVRGLLDQSLVQRPQTVGQRSGQALGIQVLGQLRAAQREHQGEQLLVPADAQPEQPGVHRCPVLQRPLGHRREQLLQLGRQLPLGQRPVVGAEQGEVAADLAVDDEVPAADPVVVPVRAQARADRHHLTGGNRQVAVRNLVRALGRVPVAAELHPHVPVGGLLAAVEQVGFHGPLVAGERIQPPGFDAPIQHEREQHLQRLRLARPVRPAQHQAAVGEHELLVAVVPQVDHAAAGRPEPVGPRSGNVRARPGRVGHVGRPGHAGQR